MKKRFVTLLLLLLTLSLVSCEFTVPPSWGGDGQNTAEIQSGEGFEIPYYTGKAYCTVNGNQPFFTEKNTESYESYSELDSLGRCGTAIACIGKDLMPTEERGSIGSVKPSGWQTVKYDCVDGKYLYNRCHLIGYQLTGENANEKNLITGTRYLNIEGMLPFENMVADYIKETNNHVLYRVTPLYTGSNLVADGVLMEAYSIEDGQDGICFCVFCYNVQPGVVINYATGESRLASEDETIVEPKTIICPGKLTSEEESFVTTEAGTQTTQTPHYVLNTNTKVFHTPDCTYAKNLGSSNRKDSTASREELIDEGYSPCGHCKP